MNRWFFSLGFALTITSTAAAPLLASGFTKAKYAGEFLSGGAGARALGMGGAYVALAGDVSAVYWNAAGLSRMEFPELILMHAERFAGAVSYNFGAFALPHGKDASLGIGVIRLGVDEIPFTRLIRSDLPLGATFEDENGAVRINRAEVDYFFSDAEYGFFLSYARAKSANFAYGGSVKIVHKGFAGESAWGIGFDLSAQARVWQRLLLGANLQDATTTLLAWSTGRKELIIPTLKLGVALPIEVGFLHGRLMPAVDADIRFENRDFASQLSAGFSSLDLHAGLEYEFEQKLALRAGSNAGFFSAGAGIRLPRLQADYAFMSHTDLGDTHRISLSIILEEKKFQRR